MTTPTLLPVGPTGEQLQIELAAANTVTQALRRQLQIASRQITALYVRYTGNTTDPLPLIYRRLFADQASQIIAGVQVDIRDDLWRMVLEALRIGRLSAQPFITSAQGYAQDLATYSRDQLYAAARRAAEQPGSTAEWLAGVAAAAQARVAAGLLSAQAAPTVGFPPASYGDALATLNTARQALTGLERDTRWATNAAFNQGVREIADAAGQSRMWIAERDACLHCLAYSGEIAQPRQPFPADLTFYIGPEGDLKPLKVYPVGPLWGPPRHPNCRCFIRPTPYLAGYPVMPWETRLYTPAMALQREARRTVLRGVSGSDSMPARLRATSALLAAGSTLPKSVRDRAARAVRRGRYGR